MADDKLVTVTNNDSNSIKLDIIAPSNKVEVDLTGSIDSMLFIHNSDEKAHSKIINSINDNLNTNISQVNSVLDTKANSSALISKADVLTTYTKNEVDSALSTKINTSDTTVTKQGNSFNGANQLVLLNSSGQLPAIDCRNLINNFGNLKVNNFGTIASSSTVTLIANAVNTCTLTGSVTFKLPVAADLVSGIENNVILDFQCSSTLPLFYMPSKIKWSSKNSYKAPTYYPTSGRNIIEFKTHDDGTTWNAESMTYGSTEQNFVSPTTMTADGDIGGSAFAVSALLGTTSGYYAFDGNNSTCLSISKGGSLKIYNPVRIRITNFRITNSSAANGFIQNYSIYGVDDNSVSILLASGTNTTLTANGVWDIGVYCPMYYQTYKLMVLTTTPDTLASMSNIAITATYTV